MIVYFWQSAVSTIAGCSLLISLVDFIRSLLCQETRLMHLLLSLEELFDTPLDLTPIVESSSKYALARLWQHLCRKSHHVIYDECDIAGRACRFQEVGKKRRTEQQ